MLAEFKKFAMRGNVADMAIGVILGAAFGNIVSSLVRDVLTPPLGLLAGQARFTDLFITLSGPAAATLEESREVGAVTINYGLFLNAVVDFLIVAFTIFLVVRQFNRLRAKEQAPPPAPTTKDCPYCLSTIPLKAVRCAHCTSEVTA